MVIAQTAMSRAERFAEHGAIEDRQILINNADWLVANAVSKGDYSLFEYSFDWPQYGLEAPWHSAMAQGQALQAPVRAHQVSGDEKYLETARAVIKSFSIDVKDGGITYKTAEDGWWYEEYASAQGRHPYVLNGMMYTFLGLYEYYEYTKDSDALRLFDLGIVSLEKNLPKYDQDGSSYYDILGNPSWEYHNVHIRLSRRLYEITNEDTFKDFHDRWVASKNPASLANQLQHPANVTTVVLAGSSVIMALGAELTLLVLARYKRPSFHFMVR